jgi:hypothetical protein
MPNFPDLANVDALVISPACPQALGNFFNAAGYTLSSTAWLTANRCSSIPFSVYAPITIVKMFVINGATVSGNIDVGIYDFWGKLLVSKGSTAQSGINAIQSFDITDTLLNPGHYYMAVVLDNTTGTLQMWTPSASIYRSEGVFETTSSFPLPDPMGFGSPSMSRVPFVGLTQRTVV